MENEMSYNITGLGGKEMGVVAAYSTGTVIYQPQLGNTAQKVAQNSLPSHRNSHR